MARPFVDDFAGDEYYVDASGGSDSNAGTSDAAAWQTINHAISTGIPAVGYNTTDGVRLNIKSNADHVITTALTSGGTLYSQLNGGSAWNAKSAFIIQGYTSVANDGGVGTIVNNCGGSVFFISDNSSSYWTMADVHMKTGTSSSFLSSRERCLFLDCAFTDGSTAGSGNAIYGQTNTRFCRCYFQTDAKIQSSAILDGCVVVRTAASFLNDIRLTFKNSLYIYHGTGSAAFLGDCFAEGSAFINVGTGTVSTGIRASSSGAVGNYFENIVTPISSAYHNRTAGEIYGNRGYNCTNYAVTFGSNTGTIHSRIYEDIGTISASPFSSIDETGFTISDGSELQYDLNIGTDNGDGWGGTIKRFAGTGGPISGGGASTPAAAVRHTRLK